MMKESIFHSILLVIIISILGTCSLFQVVVVAAMEILDQPTQEAYLHCLSTHSSPSQPISVVTYFQDNPQYNQVLSSYIRNLVFTSPSTPRPLFVVAPTHVSHIRASIICCRKYGLEVRIRSGGHDYDGLSYVSGQRFVIVDMFNMRGVSVDVEDESAWIDSGATLGEVYREIARRSAVHAFPAGVCPTVGVGGHLSGAGYGNLLRKYGLSVDNVVDAVVVDANGDVMDREAMGEELFWAIRGGGGASFGVIVSWKIGLVRVPEVVTVFRLERTLEQGASDIVYKWQHVADKIDEDLFIRLVLIPVVNKDRDTIKAKFNALFLGDAERLVALLDDKFPELGLARTDCRETSWIDSVLFWSNYPAGTSLDVLLDRHPQPEKYQKKKSDYVQVPIPKAGLEGLWRKMIHLKRPALTFNPYGGKMSEIPGSETPFPHRAGNLFKIQYSVTWKEAGDEALNLNLDRIREVYDYMTPYVSNAPRCSYLNYRDVDLGVNGIGNASYEEASVWGRSYFKDNFDRLVQVKTMVDPDNFFRYEQSIPPVLAPARNGRATE